MATLARLLSYVIGTDRGIDNKIEILKIFVILCGGGLFAAVLLLAYGLRSG
jgi:hypothetical protein